MTEIYPPPFYHLPLRECFPDVWLASSEIWMSVPLKLKIGFSRNMVAVLQDDGWVLINPVRLSEAAEEQLLDKAPFRHAVRLGYLHGRDDAYYVDTFGAQFWALPDQSEYPQPRIDQALSDKGPFPVLGAQVVQFKAANQPECVVCLPQHKLLITCDSVQNYQHDSLISPLGKVVMFPMGFFTPCVIGPLWLKMVTPKGGSLRADFQRVLDLDFANLIAGHGTPRLGDAKQALAANVSKLK